MAAIDAAYRSQRLRLISTVNAAAAAVWADGFRDRDRVIREVLRLVNAGQSQTVALVDAYLSAKTQARARGLDPELYTVAALRGTDPAEVYSRPFGAVGGQLQTGAEFGAAMLSGRASLGRLVRTDLQLAQTHSARDWMADEPRVVGYRRVLGGSKNCSLCVSASTRTYRKEDLMPIHEHCSCSVEPLFGSEPVGSVGTTVRVEDDPEIGPRLLADSWSDRGPRL